MMNRSFTIHIYIHHSVKMSNITLLLAVLIGLFGISTARDVRALSHCPDGQSALTGAYCGRGGSACPDGYFCNVSPVDAYAECCPKLSIRTTHSHCGNTQPLVDASGSPVYCGRGGVRCPDTYTCKIAPNDAWAVCCIN